MPRHTIFGIKKRDNYGWNKADLEPDTDNNNNNNTA